MAEELKGPSHIWLQYKKGAFKVSDAYTLQYIYLILLPVTAYIVKYNKTYI